MFFCLYILKFCLKIFVLKGRCKLILELLGNVDNENRLEFREYSLGSF